jgi:hypothetical protein
MNSKVIEKPFKVVTTIAKNLNMKPHGSEKIVKIF